MKLSANEEYGLRCLVRIGYAGKGGSLTIPEMSQAEGVSPAYAAKILRVLRKGGFVKADAVVDGATVVLVGDSFGWMLTRILSEQRMVSSIDYYYYFKNHFRITSPSPAPVQSVRPSTFSSR